MSDKEVILTLDGLNKLEAELNQLKTIKRREIAERIKQAIGFGDISEIQSMRMLKTSRLLWKAES